MSHLLRPLLVAVLGTAVLACTNDPTFQDAGPGSNQQYDAMVVDTDPAGHDQSRRSRRR